MGFAVAPVAAPARRTRGFCFGILANTARVEFMPSASTTTPKFKRLAHKPVQFSGCSAWRYQRRASTLAESVIVMSGPYSAITSSAS